MIPLWSLRAILLSVCDFVQNFNLAESIAERHELCISNELALTKYVHPTESIIFF